MRKLFLATLALLCTGTGAFAQYNTRIQLQLGNFGSPQAVGGYSLGSNGITTVGFSYEHQLYKHIGIRVSHQRWAAVNNMKEDYGLQSATLQLRTDKATAPVGSVLDRFQYHQLEVAPTYSLRFGRHEAFAAAGISAAYGMVSVLLRNEANNDDWNCTPFATWESQFNLGMVAEAGYNIHYLRCMSTGLSVAARYYNPQFSTYALQLNIGYNFNSFK